MSDAWNEVFDINAAPPVKAAAKRVPWAFKMWGEVSTEEKRLLTTHLKGLTVDKRKEYIKYLHNYCAGPHPSVWAELAWINE